MARMAVAALAATMNSENAITVAMRVVEPMPKIIRNTGTKAMSGAESPAFT